MEQIIDKSKHGDLFRDADLQNKQGNPTGAAEMLCSILKDGESDKEFELIEEIERAHKEAINIDHNTIVAMLSLFSMSSAEINQISMVYQQVINKQIHVA